MQTKSDNTSKCDEEIEGFVIIETPSSSGKGGSHAGTFLYLDEVTVVLCIPSIV